MIEMWNVNGKNEKQGLSEKFACVLSSDITINDF